LKGNGQLGSIIKENPLPQDAIIGTLAQDDDLQEAATASTNNAMLGAIIALLTIAKIALLIVLALLGERALLIATLSENNRT
jgi:hypothetical protein